MKFYKDMVDRMPVSDGTSQGLLYSEVLDFEADGNPELLILSIDDFAKETPGSFLMSIYRYESHGMCCLMNYYITLGAGGGLSLVESGGRLYLERYGCIPGAPLPWAPSWAGALPQAARENRSDRASNSAVRRTNDLADTMRGFPKMLP